MENDDQKAPSGVKEPLSTEYLESIQPTAHRLIVMAAMLSGVLRVLAKHQAGTFNDQKICSNTIAGFLGECARVYGDGDLLLADVREIAVVFNTNVNVNLIPMGEVGHA